MSDLAPFVATVLKDRAMVEMMAEMEELKRLVDDRLKVQITGRKGYPVYCEGSLKDGYTSHRGRCFEVMFDGDDDDDDTAITATDKLSQRRNVIKLSALKGTEVRLGGSIIQRLDLHNVIGSCNSPFFTDDNFYRDSKYNKPSYLLADRKEIIFKVKTRHKGPVPFVIAQFGSEMDLDDYRKLGNLDLANLSHLVNSEKDHTLILEGLTFSKPLLKEALSVLKARGYKIDEGNCHQKRLSSNQYDVPVGVNERFRTVSKTEVVP